MKRTSKANRGKRNAGGFTILEAMFAAFVMLIGISGLMGLFTFAAVRNAGHGDQATRTTEYAQDKMEQLLALSYTDTTSITVGSSTQSSTSGTGLAQGGSVAPNTPVVGYVDYVSAPIGTTGDVISGTSTSALYVRQWLISAPDAHGVKTITVTVTAQFSPEMTKLQVMAPGTTLVAMKEQY